MSTAQHNESCETVTSLDSGHERCQCLCHDEQPASDERRGLYGKYRVQRIGGTPGKHDHCWYYVLDFMHDEFAIPALQAYADACREKYPQLASDLDRMTGEDFLAGIGDGPVSR